MAFLMTPIPTIITDMDIYNDILSIEGGWQDDYNDSGNWTGGVVGKGELIGTHRGITPLTYNYYFGKFPTVEELKSLTADQAVQIYNDLYYKKYNIHRLPLQYQKIMLDMTINSGFYGASLVMQRAINKNGGDLKLDGYFGRISLKQLQEIQPHIDSIKIERVRYYRDIVERHPKNIKYLKGWITRALNIN